MKDSIRSPKGQFKKGLSGNLSGRPLGSRNKTTLACEKLLEGQSEQVTQKLLEMALQGNIHAIRMCMDRTTPAPKERSINLKLHPVAQLREVATQLKEIVSAVADGTITPGEGESVSRILASHAQVIEATKRVPSDEEMIAKAQLTKEYYDSIDPDIVMKKRMDDYLKFREEAEEAYARYSRNIQTGSQSEASAESPDA